MLAIAFVVWDAMGSKLWALPGADLVILLERGGSPLVQQLAEDLAHEQTNRSASSTVGARFREQLRDLIARLDKCASSSPQRWLQDVAVHSCCLHHALARTHPDRLARSQSHPRGEPSWASIEKTNYSWRQL